MTTTEYDEKASKRLAHVRSHVEKGYPLDSPLRNIETGKGNVPACFSMVSSRAQASGMLAWFDQHNLNNFKQWFYVSAKLLRMRYQLEGGTSNSYAYALEMLMPLMSDHEALIDWFSKCDLAFDMNLVDDPTTFQFLAYQTILALRGQWQRLAERCRTILDNADPAKGGKRVLPDHLFYLALAQSDIAGMEKALYEMTTPEMIHARSNAETGFTDDLISTPAVVCAKIAWRHGFQIKVDIPYIPQEWLPVAPLPEYQDPYPFMQKFNIDAPVEAGLG